MNFDFNSMTKLQSANSRVNYDLRYSGKTGKFTVSSDAFSRLGLGAHGFDAFQDANRNVILQVVPNEKSTLMSGKTSSENKSNTFAASDLAEMLGVTDDAEWNLNPIEHEGETYYMLDLLKGSIEDRSITQAPEIETVTQEQESITAE